MHDSNSPLVKRLQKHSQLLQGRQDTVSNRLYAHSLLFGDLLVGMSKNEALYNPLALRLAQLLQHPGEIQHL